MINSIFYNKPVISKSIAQNICCQNRIIWAKLYKPIYTKDHSTPHGAKFLRLGHDPSENLIKICQDVTIYKI